MCGRYALYGPSSRYSRRFGVPEDECHFGDRYNVAPSLKLPVVRTAEDGSRHVIEAVWGLLPRWVQDPKAINHPINAKAETAATKPMFRHAYRHARVLVPAAGFYEWQVRESGKQPYFIRLADDEPMGFAGLLERWEGSDGLSLSFAILTTDANELMAPIHNRMPVIVRPSDYEAWLDPALTDPAMMDQLARPYPAELMEAWPVSRAVNNARSEGPELIESTLKKKDIF